MEMDKGPIKLLAGSSHPELAKEIAKHLGLAIKKGVIVVDVQEGSTADEVGIQPQDIILQVNKVKVESIKDYTREIGKAGEKGGILRVCGGYIQIVGTSQLVRFRKRLGDSVVVGEPCSMGGTSARMYLCRETPSGTLCPRSINQVR